MGRTDPVTPLLSTTGPLSTAEIDAMHEWLDGHPKLLVEDLDGQCLAVAAAAQLRVPVGSLPRVPSGSKDGVDRWRRWVAAMQKAGYELEDLDRSQLPPADGRPWIAIVDAPGRHTHALPVIGLTVINDGSECWPSIRPASVLSAFRFTAA
jgi:hypothetical protein